MHRFIGLPISSVFGGSLFQLNLNYRHVWLLAGLKSLLKAAANRDGRQQMLSINFIDFRHIVSIHSVQWTLTSTVNMAISRIYLVWYVKCNRQPKRYPSQETLGRVRHSIFNWLLHKMPSSLRQKWQERDGLMLALGVSTIFHYFYDRRCSLVSESVFRPLSIAIVSSEHSTQLS